MKWSDCWAVLPDRTLINRYSYYWQTRDKTLHQYLKGTVVCQMTSGIEVKIKIQLKLSPSLFPTCKDFIWGTIWLRRGKFQFSKKLDIRSHYLEIGYIYLLYFCQNFSFFLSPKYILRSIRQQDVSAICLTLFWFVLYGSAVICHITWWCPRKDKLRAFLSAYISTDIYIYIIFEMRISMR